MKSLLTEIQTSNLIRLAWEDRTTFEEIHAKTGFTEPEVVVLMRRELKPGSFRAWRKRMSGQVTKHRKLLSLRLAGPTIDPDADF